MRAEELFAIDVAAEISTLCEAQIQGPWQVPAELVRLANARGAAAVTVDRRGRGLVVRCDGVLADADELADLVGVFDPGRSRRRRQDAIGRVEAAGLSALLWAAGLPGARLELESRTGGSAARLRARRGRVETMVGGSAPGPPSTVISWRCRGLVVRRAVAWLRTALRFVPIPVKVSGRPVTRGFPNGLYRMRISQPLPAELAVTADGDSPKLWLLEHGVLSARAVVPGYPAFSAAVEMTGATGQRSNPDDLRSAVNPYLEQLIDQAVRMLVLLGDRVATAPEPTRRRLGALLLRAAVLGLRRDQIRALPIVPCHDGGERRMATPSEVGRRASLRGGVVTAVDPGSRSAVRRGGWQLEVSAEERTLLSELLGVRIELAGDAARTPELGSRLAGHAGRAWFAMRGLAPCRPLGRDRLSDGERALVDAAGAVGVELVLCPGSGSVRTRRGRILVGRERSEVTAAVTALAGGDEWLYPVLLAVTGEVREPPAAVRRHWLECMTARSSAATGPEV